MPTVESVRGPVELSDHAAGEPNGAAAEGDWDWKQVELKRRKGMEFAERFAALDGLHREFDCGEDGALGKFSVG